MDLFILVAVLCTGAGNMSCEVYAVDSFQDRATCLEQQVEWELSHNWKTYAYVRYTCEDARTNEWKIHIDNL